MPTGFVWDNGTILGPQAMLAGVTAPVGTASKLDLFGATLTGADLSALTLSNVSSGLIVCWGSVQLPSSWVLENGLLLGPSANLTGESLSGMNLGTVNLSSATLTGVASGDVSGAPVLPGSWSLTGGYLVGPGADLEWAQLTNLGLQGANLKGADLTGAALDGSNLSGSNLTGATMTALHARSILGCPTLSTGWLCASGLLIGPGADLSWATLSGLNLTTVSLAGANLSSSTLSGDNVQGTNFAGATLTDVASASLSGVAQLPSGWGIANGYLVGPTAQLAWSNLTGANLSSTNLAGANLTGSNLSGANLTGASLSGAELTGVISGSLIGCPQLDAGWLCAGGLLIGPGANLAWQQINGVSFAGAALTGTNFTGADLTNDVLGGADFSGAVLNDVNSDDVTGTGTLPAGFTLVDGYLAGPGAQLEWDDLANAALPGANLTGANLSGTNLSDANLAGATLTGATVSGAVFAGANLTGVVALSLIGTPASLPSGWVLLAGALSGP
jgi:uncharacterized protein YjbI with pentapeptide repeats